MWRLLQNPIPDTLRAELETRIGSVLDSERDHDDRAAEHELKGFFAASRGAGALLRQLLDQPGPHTIIAERLTDPVVFSACPTVKRPGAPARPYHTDDNEWGGPELAASLFTLWFAITEATVGNGCLRMASGSAEGERTLAAVARMSSLELARLSAPSYDASMKAGQVLFFDSSQLYGAYPNHSERPRIAVKAVLGERAALKGRDYREIQDYGSVGLVAKQGWRKLFGG